VYVNRERAGREGRKGSEGQSHKEDDRERWNGMGMVQGPEVREGQLHLHICAGALEFLVTPLLMGPVCLLSQGQFGEPVRPWPRNHLLESKPNLHTHPSH